MEPNEIEKLRREQEQRNLTDAELKGIEENPLRYDPFENPKGEPCEVCGQEDCIKAFAYIPSGPLHWEDHPENQHSS